jgi:hypothetical protein
MNKSNDSEIGKTMVHGRGAGQFSDADIERRAREIALINGRSAEEVFTEDREQAKNELMGDDVPKTTVEDVESVGALSRDPSNPPAFYDRGLPTNEGPDEKKDLERIVLDGVEEAQHDQMLQARRRREE